MIDDSCDETQVPNSGNLIKILLLALALLILGHDFWQGRQKAAITKQAGELSSKLVAAETQLSAAGSKSAADKAALDGAAKELAAARSQVEESKKAIEELKQQAAQTAARTAGRVNGGMQPLPEVELAPSSSPEDLFGTWKVLSRYPGQPAHLFEFRRNGTAYDILEFPDGAGGTRTTRRNKTWAVQDSMIVINDKTDGARPNPSSSFMQVSLPFNKNRLELCTVNASQAMSNTTKIFAEKSGSEQDLPPEMQLPTPPPAAQQEVPKQAAVAPAPTPSPVAAVVNKEPPINLVPQSGYLSTMGADRVASLELYDAIKPELVPKSRFKASSEVPPNGSLEISEFPEILNGVTLMMPLKEALKKLELTKQLLPPKSTVSYPGIPFYFRPFQNKRDSDGKAIVPPAAPGSGHYGDDPSIWFNLIFIVTDNADRVVGIEFVCETPKSQHPPDKNLLSYNYVLNRRKVASSLGVRREVNKSNTETLLIETWLSDYRAGKGLEIVKWYVPTRITNFMRYVIKTRLNLPD